MSGRDTHMVLGTLKDISTTRDGSKYILKGDWDDKRDAQLVTPAEFQHLVTAEMVVKDGTWPSGDQRWKVISNDTVGVEVTFQGKGRAPLTRVVIAPNGNTQAQSSSSDDREFRRGDDPLTTLGKLGKLYFECAHEVDSRVPGIQDEQARSAMYATLFIQACKLELWRDVNP